MLLVLARHGNTFEAGEKPVWIGARTDLPLTAQGRNQAAAFGAALRPVAARVRRILSGPLLRTREYAEIAARTAGVDKAVEVDARLCELDYGVWEGKTSEEIEAAYGAADLEAWAGRSRWPRSAGWTPPEATVIENVRALAGSIAAEANEADIAVLVTSNGILRFFLTLVPSQASGMAAGMQVKVATGHACVLGCAGDKWQMLVWNKSAADLSRSGALD